MTLMFRDRTADVTYCANVTLFLYATSGGLSLTVAFFPSNIIPPKHAEQDQIDVKWLEKNMFSDARVEEQVEA